MLWTLLTLWSRSRQSVQTVERLWPLVDESIVNRHFASLAELDATVAERCRRLDAATIRPHTDFHWWSKPKKPN